VGIQCTTVVTAAVAKNQREMRTLLDTSSRHRSKAATYIPAFGLNFLTPFYDSMMKYAARESTFKPELVEQAGFAGIDADPKVLEIARSKVAKAGVDIALDQGTAYELPYPDASFDRVVSSMVFHHLTREYKFRALKEVFRVLRPGGEFHIADLGRPQNAIMHLISLVVGRLEEASDNMKGLLPEMLRDTGFDNVEETARYMTAVGTVNLYRAQKLIRQQQLGH